MTQRKKNYRDQGIKPFVSFLFENEMQKLRVPLSWLQTVVTSIFSFIQEDSTHFEYCIHNK